jgi:hypothetical protein
MTKGFQHVLNKVRAMSTDNKLDFIAMVSEMVREEVVMGKIVVKPIKSKRVLKVSNVAFLETPKSVVNSGAEDIEDSLFLGGIKNEAANTLIQKKEYRALFKDSKSIRDFININRPKFAQPYVDLYNLFAEKYDKPKVNGINKDREYKTRLRASSKTFDFPKVLIMASESDFIKSNNFFSYDWLITNDSNYLKVIEGNYKNRAEAPKPTISNQTSGLDAKIYRVTEDGEE